MLTILLTKFLIVSLSLEYNEDAYEVDKGGEFVLFSFVADENLVEFVSLRIGVLVEELIGSVSLFTFD